MRGETKILTFQAPMELAEQLRALADERDRSLSAEVRRAVQTHLLLSDRRNDEVVASGCPGRVQSSSRGPGGTG
jgi:predicted transcriptional regulator